MDTNGLLGAMTISSALSNASSTPGAGVAVGSPSKRTRSTSSRCSRATNHSWKANDPAGVSTHVRRASSVAGSNVRGNPKAVASLPVTVERGSPRRRACVRTRWRPRSRSPRRNHVSPLSTAAVAMACHVSSARPQPRSSSATSASAYRMLSRSGETCRPSTSTSSPTLPITVTDDGSVTSTSPRRNRAPPTPPESTASFGIRSERGRGSRAGRRPLAQVEPV